MAPFDLSRKILRTVRPRTDRSYFPAKVWRRWGWPTIRTAMVRSRFTCAFTFSPRKKRRRSALLSEQRFRRKTEKRPIRGEPPLEQGLVKRFGFFRDLRPAKKFFGPFAPGLSEFVAQPAIFH